MVWGGLVTTGNGLTQVCQLRFQPTATINLQIYKWRSLVMILTPRKWITTNLWADAAWKNGALSLLSHAQMADLQAEYITVAILGHLVWAVFYAAIDYRSRYYYCIWEQKGCSLYLQIYFQYLNVSLKNIYLVNTRTLFWWGRHCT